LQRVCPCPLCLLVLRCPPGSTLFPYTTLFRSRSGPSVDRPLQDGLLLRAVIRSVRVRPPDVVLAHHVEAVAVMAAARRLTGQRRSEEHTSELQSRENLVCRLLLEKKKKRPTAD